MKDRVYSDSPDYAAIDPETELIMVLDDFRSGFGLEHYDSDDTKRYYSSIGADGRFRGMFIAGPTPTTVTKPASTNLTTANITNADFEHATSGWTEAGVWTQSTLQAHSPSNSWVEESPGDGENIYQDITGFHPGVEYTFTCWIYQATGVLETKIGINDGVTTTYGTKVTAYNTWTQASHTKTLSLAATRLRLIVEVETTSGNKLFVDDAALSTTAATVGTTPRRGWAEFNDKLYVAFGRILAKLNAGGTGFDFVAYMPATITCLEPYTDDLLYICQGTGAAYYTMTTADPPVFVLNTLANNTMQYMRTVHTTVDTMYANETANTIRSTINPANGGTAWSNPATTVGASYHAIQDLLDKSGALYIPKEDMIYYLNSAGAVKNDLAPRLQALTSSTSGQNALTDGQIIMYPAGAQGLLEIDGTTLTWRNPASYCTNLTDFVGRVQAVAYDEEYWFAIVDNSTEVEILAGRSESIDGTTRFVWHPIAEITLTNCNTAWVSSVFQKRLWIASDTASEALYYVPLPTGYGDITNDANKLFKTNTSFIVPALHSGFRGKLKAFIKVVAELGHPYDADIYFECHYQKLGDGTPGDPGDAGWTDAGDFKGTATNVPGVSSRIATLYLPPDSSGNEPITSMLWFKLVCKTDTPTKTPILNSLKVHAILYETTRNIIECVVRCADNIYDKLGEPLQDTDAAYIKTVLEEARDATYPLTFYDIYGDTITCRLLAVTPFSTVTASRKDENPEQLFQLRLLEVPTS